MTRHTVPPITLAAAFVVLAACSGSSAKNEERQAELRSQRRSLLTQFSATQNAIRRVQSLALEEPGVRAAQEAFNEQIRTVVQRDDPASLELLDRARRVGHDLESLGTPILLQEGEEDPRPVEPEERAEVAAELAEVERDLRPVIDRAFQDPSVAAAFASLRDSVVAAMLRIDPGTQRSMDLMADLEGRMGEIDAEITRLSQ